MEAIDKSGAGKDQKLLVG